MVCIYSFNKSNTLLRKYNLKDTKNWILGDTRTGSTMQSIALADEMQIDYCVIDIEYSIFGILPNYLLPFGFWHVKSPDFRVLLKSYRPELIISASRKSALISASIKQIIPSVQNINILKPDLPIENFDFVILPQHDTGVPKKQANILKIIGALTSVHTRIAQTLGAFNEHYPNLASEKYIAVLIGGNTRDFYYRDHECTKFYDALLRISRSNDCRMIITYSRRTPINLKRKLDALSSEWVTIFDPIGSNINPYPALLQNAKYVISTCDSISMCSEVASCGKPLYLYKPRNFKSNKHLTFIYQLQDLGIAKLIKDDTDFLQEYNYTPLNESARISDYILSSLYGVK